jgi:serine/threonine protein kinase
MTLVAGTKLGPYEILSPLGTGGMGEVYRARDTRLGRDVAVKILPERLVSSADFPQRLEREARAISSLQHPHIFVLYDVGHDQAAGEFLLSRGPGKMASLARRRQRTSLARRRS